jgi:hypothetical protein
MDYVSGPTSKWRGLYIISVKIGINTWLYLKTENGPEDVVWMQNLTAPMDSWQEIVQEMTIKSLNYVTTHPRPPGLFASIKCATAVCNYACTCVENSVMYVYYAWTLLA